MKLQELIGELQTLSLAYPSETEVLVRTHDVSADITGLTVDSDESGITILLDTAL